jgi:ribonuclease G
VYTEMDLALRMVRDAFGPEYKRLVVDDKRLFEKVVSFLKKTSPDLVRKVTLHKERTPVFDAQELQPQIDTATLRNVALPSGGHITIDKTEALTAIDVNTGSYVGRKNLEDTILRTNLEAAEEAVRQLRLRDIGGIIVIDFIDMESTTHRAEVSKRLNDALERDRTKTRTTEISRLGLVEMTRKNVTDGLYGVLTAPCPTCHGEGRVLSDATRRIAAERRIKEILVGGRSSAYLLGLQPETYALVTAPGNNTIAILRAETGKGVALVADPDCGPTEVKIVIEGRGNIAEATAP